MSDIDRSRTGAARQAQVYIVYAGPVLRPTPTLEGASTADLVDATNRIRTINQNQCSASALQTLLASMPSRRQHTEKRRRATLTQQQTT